MWSTVSCALALACRSFVSKEEEKEIHKYQGTLLLNNYAHVMTKYGVLEIKLYVYIVSHEDVFTISHTTNLLSFEDVC